MWRVVVKYPVVDVVGCGEMQGDATNVGLPRGMRWSKIGNGTEMHNGCEIREMAGQPGTWTVYCKVQGYPNFRYVA